MLAQLIFMPVDSGSGPQDPLAYLSMIILINIIGFSIFTIRAIIWFIKHPVFNYGYKTVYKDDKIPFWRYCMWMGDDGFTDLYTMVWWGLNALALLVYGSWFIYHMMGGTHPFS